jgi:Tol biopolymer transport system component
MALSLVALGTVAETWRVGRAADHKSESQKRERIILWMDGSDSPVDRQITAIGLADQKLHRLTELPYDSQPGHSVVVSPDGKTIAYLSNETAPPEGGLVTWTLFLRPTEDPKGKGRSLGVDKVTHIGPWSPDGKQLIVTIEGSGEAERQMLVNAQTGGVKSLDLPKAEAPAGARYFSGHFVTDWSPDGESFLTTCVYRDKSEKWNAEMYLVKCDGSSTRRLAHIAHGVRGVFSPDGKRILYVGQHEENGKSVDQLYVADVAGGKPVRVSSELSGMLGVWGFCWSPDGKRIAYIWDNREEGDAHEVFVMLVDGEGKNAHVLCSRKSPGRGGLSSPNWR